MFDKTKPNNNLLKLPRDIDFRDIDLLIQLNKTNEAIWKLQLRSEGIPNKNILLESIWIKESVSSNKVENIYTTIDAVYQSELTLDSNKVKKEDKEAMNYKEAIKYWLKVINEKWWLTLKDICDINEIIIRKSSWVVSSPNKKIQKEYPNGEVEIIYTPPVWIDLIKDLLHNLLKYYNNFNQEKEIDILLKLPIIHYQFEAIHPFSDGNGRVGRIIVVLYLCLSWKLDTPIIYLSEFFLSHEDEYKTYLNKIDCWEKGILKEFILWFLAWIEYQALSASNMVSNIVILKLEIERKLSLDKNFNNISIVELSDLLFIRPFYTIQSMSKYFNKSRITVTKYLDILVEEKILDFVLDGRKKIFVFPEYLNLLRWKKWKID